MQRRTLLAALPLLSLPTQGLASAPPQTLQAPNVVPIDAGLVTSGMPSLQSLDALAALGFSRLLHLVPLEVPGMVPDEPERVRALGLRFDHVPIPWDGPTLSHVDAVFAVLDDWQRQSSPKTKGLVHCEVNMRASCCTFLWRVLRRQESPEAAWESVTRVWTPRGRWRALVEQALARGGVRFEPW